jgi:hypothetical protein
VTVEQHWYLSVYFTNAAGCAEGETFKLDVW